MVISMPAKHLQAVLMPTAFQIRLLFLYFSLFVDLARKLFPSATFFLLHFLKISRCSYVETNCWSNLWFDRLSSSNSHELENFILTNNVILFNETINGSSNVHLTKQAKTWRRRTTVSIKTNTLFRNKPSITTYKTKTKFKEVIMSQKAKICNF